MRKFCFIAFIILAFALSALALQDNSPPIVVPGFFALIFSAAFLESVGVAIGGAALANRLLNLQGTAAFVLAVLACLGYGILKYYDRGLGYAIAVGVVAAVAATISYWGSKKLNNAFIGTLISGGS